MQNASEENAGIVRFAQSGVAAKGFAVEVTDSGFPMLGHPNPTRTASMPCASTISTCTRATW
ncbi:MAG: hypothetical protein NZL93_04150 [Chthoniobacterales bacterium]|nr:hypothetical protein [Chthoniobacterales bacterium]